MSDPAAIPPSDKSSPQRIVVLLVDDQRMIGEVVRRLLLDQTDIDFHFCLDPQEAVERVQHLQPHVILQDLVMPQVGGLELVKRYREDPPASKAAIIVLSAADEGSIKHEARCAGADDFLVKLPAKESLLTLIRHHAKRAA